MIEYVCSRSTNNHLIFRCLICCLQNERFKHLGFYNTRYISRALSFHIFHLCAAVQLLIHRAVDILTSQQSPNYGDLSYLLLLLILIFFLVGKTYFEGRMIWYAIIMVCFAYNIFSTHGIASYDDKRWCA